MASSKANVLGQCNREVLEEADPYRALDVLASRIRAAVEGGMHGVLAEAERCITEFASASRTRIVVNAAGVWRPWRQLELLDAGSSPERVPDHAAFLTGFLVEDRRIILPIRPGSIVALIDDAVVSSISPRALAIVANCIDVGITAGEHRDNSARNATETQVLRNVASQILQSVDLEEIFLLVSHETKRLLASDICGVMMRDGHELMMRSCVGHFSVDMTKLRMEAGQGVAGRVLATSQPCIVENYVDSDAISRDFMPLARVERVRSALAVPIVSRDAVIGVLEVWRRRPSTYTSEDTDLLLALAGLTSLAVVNAELLQSHARAADELAAANAALALRCKTIEESARFQERIVQLILSGCQLSVLAEATAEHAEGAVFVLDRDLALETAKPHTSEATSTILDQARLAIKRVNRIPDQAIVKKMSIGHMLAQPVLAGAELLGWIIWYGEVEPPETTKLALSHVSLAVAMHLLERRNIARARAETFHAVLWDLLEGNEIVNAAALDRARELHVCFKGKVCILVSTLEGIGADENNGHISDLTYVTDRLLERARLSEIGRSSHMVGLRGNQLRMICKARDSEALTAAGLRLIDDLKSEIPSLSMKVGFSSQCVNLRKLPSFFREAAVALEVAQYQRGRSVVCYSDVGLLGLLINLRSKADISRVSEEILGDLMKEPQPSRQVLLETLQAFFECDCSQNGTASKLGLHQKTIAYRLMKASQLTGLKFTRHKDRLLADIAVRLCMMAETGEPVSVDCPKAGSSSHRTK
jgi:sugar diacid utilization regulator/GAF domain-containing protein